VSLANALTALRGAAVVPVVLFIALGDVGAALVVFALASATDALDGFVARRTTGATAFGAAIDPLADKTLVVGTLTALTIGGMAPAWPVAAIVARELIAVERRARASRSLPAATDGKAKTVLQVVAVLALLAARLWPSPEVATAAGLGIVLAAALTVLSGVRLLVRASKTTAHAA
jgi:CDP-diacylglycerol--glycerol-3-phosphate 3-phosphatidyltransferase